MLRCSEEEVHPLRPAQRFHQEAELFCLELVEQAGCALCYCRAVPLELFDIRRQGVLQDERVHLQQVGVLLELSLEGEGVVDLLLQLDGVFEELCEGVFVVVEEGGDERVACGGLEILQSFPELSGQPPLQKLGVFLLIDFLDDLEILIL